MCENGPFLLLILQRSTETWCQINEQWINETSKVDHGEQTFLMAKYLELNALTDTDAHSQTNLSRILDAVTASIYCMGYLRNAKCFLHALNCLGNFDLFFPEFRVEIPQGLIYNNVISY